MTLGEGRRKVLMLMDEYSSGGSITTDKDIDLKMIDFFNLAQRNVAGYKKIIRSVTPEADPEAVGTVPVQMPQDFGGPFRVWMGERMTQRYGWRGDSILIPASDLGKVTVEYFAVPAEIPQGAPDTTQFEVSEDAAACMPYFVAAQQLMVDLITDPAPLMGMYDRMVAGLDMRLPAAGGGGVRQSLYRKREA